MRRDGVNPGLLGIEKMVSEDTLRRAFLGVEEEAAIIWLQKHLNTGCRAPRKTFWDIPVNQNVLGGATNIFDAADVLVEKSLAILSK